ncbi:MAG: hypothetical protein ABGZ35_03210 [Planctomycetaceae bacterium]
MISPSNPYKAPNETESEEDRRTHKGIIERVAEAVLIVDACIPGPIALLAIADLPIDVFWRSRTRYVMIEANE